MISNAEPWRRGEDGLNHQLFNYSAFSATPREKKNALVQPSPQSRHSTYACHCCRSLMDEAGSLRMEFSSNSFGFSAEPSHVFRTGHNIIHRLATSLVSKTSALDKRPITILPKESFLAIMRNHGAIHLRDRVRVACNFRWMAPRNPPRWMAPRNLSPSTSGCRRCFLSTTSGRSRNSPSRPTTCQRRA